MINYEVKTNIEEYLELLKKVEAKANEFNKLTEELDKFEIQVNIEETAV